MNNLEIEEMKQLLNFYRHKSNELELENLKLQIKLNSLTSENTLPL
jgi:hypothetical protein